MTKSLRRMTSHRKQRQQTLNERQGRRKKATQLLARGKSLRETIALTGLSMQTVTRLKTRLFPDKPDLVALCAAAQTAHPGAIILLSKAEEHTIAKHFIKRADRGILADVADLKSIAAEMAARSEKCSKKVTPTDEWVRGSYVRNMGSTYRKDEQKYFAKTAAKNSDHLKTY